MNNWHEEIQNRKLEWNGYMDAITQLHRSETEGERLRAERLKEELLRMLIASIDHKVFLLATGLKEEIDTIKSHIEKIEQGLSRFIKGAICATIIFLVLISALVFKAFVE